jgi:hypothetical protein
VPEADRARGIRLRELRLTGATGSDRSYGVSFLDLERQSWRPLSIIAGPSQTGKTSVVDFVRYCLGDAEHPQHQEILAYVRAALLETDLAGETTTIERAAAGPPSSFASLWKASLGSLSTTAELRVSTEPPSDPDGLSQLVLAACGLDNVALPEAPKQTESRTQVLSVRDLFRIMWLPNDRLDSKNLVFEHANFMVRQKLMQTIDVMFEVHDAAGSDLAARLKRATDATREAERIASALRVVVQAEHPLGPLVLETDRDQARREAAQLAARLAELDRGQMSQQNTLTDMRRALEQARTQAQNAALRVRNRESLMERLAALRGQYADDKKKLTFLKEAERLFNPLQVTVCPACLSTLDRAPSALDGRCSLCGHGVSNGGDGLNLGSAADALESSSQLELPSADDDAGVDHAVAVLQAELRATTRRLDELTDYWNRLDDDLKILKGAQEDADRAVNEAAAALNRSADVPAPYLASRDDLSRRRADALLREQTAEAGLRLWARVQTAEDNAHRLAGQAAHLRAERKEAANPTERPWSLCYLSVSARSSQTWAIRNSVSPTSTTGSCPPSVACRTTTPAVAVSS